MDAHAHLLSLGWAGPGHALDSRPYKQKGHRGLAYDPETAAKSANTGNGLVKPLLVSQRKSRFGIGKKAHEPQSGNEWWLKGFQSALDNIGKSESERSSGASTPINNGHHGKHTGLYGYFIRGQMMQGTIDEQSKRGKKRKSDVLEEEDDDDAETGNPLAVSPVKKDKTAKDLEDSVAFLAERDKDRKRKEKYDPGTDAEQFAAIGNFFGAAEMEKKRGKKFGASQTIQDETSGTSTPQDETKEERRARRRKWKEGRVDRELSLAEMVEEELARLEADGPGDYEDATARATKRAERKRRKAEKAMNGI